MGKKSISEMETEAADVSMNDTTGPVTDKDEYAHLCTLVNPIAQPMANRKLAKKVYKLIKHAAKDNKNLRQGVREVQKSLRKDEKGILVLAGNVTPIDIYSHIPAICEEKEIPYVYTPSREHLGLAGGHRRPAVLVFIKPQLEYQDLYREVSESVNKLVVE